MVDSVLKFAKDCGIELNRSTVLRQLCTAEFTEKLKEQYQDSRMMPGDSYGIYNMDRHPSVYFVLFHNYNTKQCRQLQPTKGIEFQCYNGIDRTSTLVSLGKSTHITCVKEVFSYTEDLLAACGVQSSPQPVTTVFHYAEPNKEVRKIAASAASSHFFWELLLVFLIASLLVCLFNRFRK